jgi:hypothetical protein
MVDKLAERVVWTRADSMADMSVPTWAPQKAAQWAAQKAAMKVVMMVDVLAAAKVGWLVETKASLKIARSAQRSAAGMVVL